MWCQRTARLLRFATDGKSLMRGVVLIDPENEIGDTLRTSAFSGWRLEHFDSSALALARLRESGSGVGLVCVPAVGPDEITHSALLAQPGVEWVALARPQALTEPRLRALIRRAFFDYHTLPIDVPRLLLTLGHAHGKAQLELPASRASSSRFGMIGSSPAMHALFRQIERVLTSQAPVLIGGESGTGKELVARAIAEHSTRSNAPFVAINCGAIPANLIQSELFGHEKGAFTGAIARKIGCIEAAAGGVLFLDEIGDLPLDLQANLLRFLQERRIVRLGATTPIAIDTRVIAASHVDLERAVREHRFREDLFYRLNVLALRVPPLRERGADILLLADYWLGRLAASVGSVIRGFHESALQAMLAHRWPGNVRELINRVQRAMVMCEGRWISPQDLDLAQARSEQASLDSARIELERSLIERSLSAHRHNVSQTARTLGISRVTLYRMMHRLNIVN